MPGEEKGGRGRGRGEWGGGEGEGWEGKEVRDIYEG